MRIGIFAVMDHYPQELARTVGMLYGELLAQAELADEAGFDSFWVAEHHFHEYGAMPRPAVFLAAASQRTKRIRLGSAVAVLPLDNPLRIAEDYAMLDVLSGGRLNLGIGSGYLRHEFDGLSVPYEEKRARFDEALDIIRQAFLGQRFSYAGRYYNFENVQLNVTPLQKPSPPVWVATLGSEPLLHLGKRGLPVMVIPYAASEKLEDLAAPIAGFRQAFASSSRAATEPSVPFGLHIYCAEDTATAIADAEDAMNRYVRTRLFAKQRSVELLRERGLVAIGDPDHICSLLERYAAIGMTHCLALTSFGGLPHEKVIRSMQLLTKHVLPRFHGTAPGSVG